MRHMHIMKRVSLLGVLVFGLVGGTINAAFATSIFDVSIDTTSLSGTAANLAFDLIDGDFVINNTATVTNFSTDGSLSAASSLGGPVTGTLPGTTTIGDTDFFNELLQPITLGNSISFTLELTENNPGALIPDQFSFFILDDFLFPLFATSDPFGADALFAVDITGAADGDLMNFTATSGSVSWSVTPAGNVAPVPEPSSILLFGAGIAGFAAYRRWSMPTRT